MPKLKKRLNINVCLLGVKSSTGKNNAYNRHCNNSVANKHSYALTSSAKPACGMMPRQRSSD